LKLTSLKNKSDFDLIFEKNSLKVSSGDFDVLLVFKNKKEINYGFVFPKKNINLAVNRNFAKRSAKEMLKTLNPKKGFDIVFLVRKKIINFDKDKVKKNFAELKRKIEFCF
jgi:ribonuclease P protein component